MKTEELRLIETNVMQEIIMTKRTLELDLPDEWWARLDRLSGCSRFDSLEGFISGLLDHVQQGVYRSGAWEHEWLESVVGTECLAAAYEMEEDPAYLRDMDDHSSNS